MNEEIKNLKENRKNTFFAVALCELILAVLLVSSAFALKYFFPKEFSKAKKWYGKNIMTYTSISDIVKGAENET